MTQHWTSRSVEDFLSRITFDFITQLEKKMESLSLRQVDLAKKLGKTEGAVSQTLNNPPNLGLKKIVEYARAIGLKVAIVAYDDNDPDNEQGLVNSEIFSICWEKQGKPVDFFALNEMADAVPAQVGLEQRSISTLRTQATEAGLLFTEGNVTRTSPDLWQSGKTSAQILKEVNTKETLGQLPA